MGTGGGDFSAEVSAEACFSFFFFASEVSRSRRLGAGACLVCANTWPDWVVA